MPATSIESSYGSDEARWRAVLGRDAGASGRFFYAVRTTGVVCRPGCASRSPRRENVAFYARLERALADGFRACRRCRPGSAAPTPEWIIDTCRRIEAAERLPTQATLASAAGLAPATFARRFRAALGVTPNEYGRAVRAERFRAALGDAESVLDAAYAAGFGAPSRMYAQADGMLGMSPGQYRAGGAGVSVAVASARCRLGAVAVAATSRGVCAVELGPTPEAVAEAIAGRLPAAEAADPVPELALWLARIVAQIDEAGPAADVPLDIQGTAFQQRVWRALRAIPRGQTRSYAALADALGQPTAARAVARACATNPVAVLVPCHRVVRADGALSGYRWGVARKRALLEAEGARPAGDEAD